MGGRIYSLHRIELSRLAARWGPEATVAVMAAGYCQAIVSFPDANTVGPLTGQLVRSASNPEVRAAMDSNNPPAIHPHQYDPNDETPRRASRWKAQLLVRLWQRGWNWGTRVGSYYHTLPYSNTNGFILLERPGEDYWDMILFSSRPGFARYRIYWDDSNPPPESPDVTLMEMEPGVPIGGVVLNEKGEPVQGAG